MNKIWKKLGVVAVFGLGATMFGGQQAEAATAVDTANMLVNATVNANCLVSVTSNITFPVYDPAAPSVASAGGTVGTIAVDCANGLPFWVQVDSGSTTGGTGASFAMTNGIDNLAYTLSLVGGGAVTPNADFVVGVNGNGYTGGVGDQTYQLDGTIPAGQLVSAGAYQDTLVVTLGN